MHWLDLAIIAVLAWMTFTAFRAGLIRQIVGLLSVIVGGLVAGRLYDRLAANIDFIVEQPEARNLIAFVAIFAGFLVLGQVAALMLRGVAALLFLGPLDRLGGAAFGFIQGVLVVAFLLFAATTFPANDAIVAALEQSRLAPLFLEQLPLLEGLLPEEFRGAVGGFRSGLPLPAFPGMDLLR